MGLEDVIGDFAEDGTEGSFTVTRSTTVGNGYNANGREVADSLTSLPPVDGIWFPIFPRDLLVLEEGQRSEDSKTFFTETPIIGRNKSNAPDVITIDGEDYVAWSVRHWKDIDGDFYQVVLARRPTGGGP